MTATKKIENVGPEQIDAFGWQVQRGYVFSVEVPADLSLNTIYDLDDGSQHVESCEIGYHGNAVPPCGAEYLYQSDDGGEFFVISSESDPEQIDKLPGVVLTPVEFKAGDYRHDGVWEFRVLEVKSDGEVILAGTTH